MSQEETQQAESIQVDTRVVLAYQGRIAELESQLVALRSQLEAAKEDRDSAESKAASYEAMEPYATVKLLQGQLEAANRDLRRQCQQLEASSMAIEDTLHAQLGAIASAIYPEKESGFTYSVAFMVQEILELRRDRDIANRGRTAILAMKDRADELRGFAEGKLENVTAELETAEQEIREWEESLKINQRDYEDMRRFQGKFIEADQERRTLKGQLETARLERDRDEVTITAQAWQLGELKTKMEAVTLERDEFARLMHRAQAEREHVKQGVRKMRKAVNHLVNEPLAYSRDYIRGVRNSLEAIDTFLCMIPTWPKRALFLVFVGVCWWMVAR